MLKVNLVDFHCLIIYKDIIENKYIINNSSLHWLKNSLISDAVYLARWKYARIKNVKSQLG